MTKQDILEIEAQELAQDCREEEMANWAEMHSAEQNRETGEWEV